MGLLNYESSFKILVWYSYDLDEGVEFSTQQLRERKGKLLMAAEARCVGKPQLVFA